MFSETAGLPVPVASGEKPAAGGEHASGSYGKWCEELATGAKRLRGCRNAAGLDQIDLARKLMQSTLSSDGHQSCAHPPGLRWFDSQQDRLVCTVCGTVLEEGSRIEGAEDDSASRAAQYTELEGVPESGVRIAEGSNAFGQQNQHQGPDTTLQEAYSLLKRVGGRLSLPALIRDNATQLWRHLSGTATAAATAEPGHQRVQLGSLPVLAVVAGLISVASRMGTPVGQARLTREVIRSV